MWYSQPADASAKDHPSGWENDAEWLKALPLGNGSLGVMVFGDVNRERIQLNEESMWSGSYDENDNPDAFEAQAEIRRLLFDGKYREATALANRTQVCRGAGSGHGNGAKVPFGSFQTLGDLWIDNGKQAAYEDYYRELDLDDAVVRVRYRQDGVNYRRELFVSQPDRVMVMRLVADKPGQLSFTCGMNRPECFSTRAEGGQLVMSGALPDGRGGRGLEYAVCLKAVPKNGTVRCRDSLLVVENADEVVLLLSASTGYMLRYPVYKGRDYRTLVNENIKKAAAEKYDHLLIRHRNEYQPYFKRVRLDLTPDEVAPVPVDVRLADFRKTLSDNHLVELFFQYGRYLLIASSRPGTLPANLQGIWTNKLQTPWNGDYHTDINVQMNYWPAGTANLPEMQLPLFDLIESIAEPGRKTAAVQYRLDGWVVHPITNVWGYTAPGEVASWGMHTGAGAWICTHIAEHYAFTRDRAFLERMYPALKGSAEFYAGWLVENPATGLLVSGPAVSPENTFIAPDGSHCQISMGPAHDQQVIAQLFRDFLMASDELGIADAFVEKIRNSSERLAGPQIASDGRLMEWAEEFPETEPGHRHISHLFALHPGSQINREQTPELAAAAKRSLDFRIASGGGHTGWSAAWLISQYARLHEAGQACKNIHTVLSKSASPNLFGQHPPFQMDANFGTTAGIAEMLLQSHEGNIRLLPALPAQWPEGTVTGLKARGNYELDITWKNSKLVSAIIHAARDGDIEVKYGDNKKLLSPKAGEKATVSFE
ncbi:MAG: glycoside hydrolase family 95 protein [Tannerella sp.]|nr:glycoside hydrolase family 95 protein [Tannerella sp.]